jgi:hypothetical protein
MTTYPEQLARSTMVDSGRWAFAGEVDDNLQFNGQCSFCAEQNLRFTFVLSESGEGMGSICQACLSQSEISVDHEGRSLTGKGRSDYLNGLTVRAALRSSRDVLRQLMACNADPAMKEAAVYFDRYVQLSPAYAATVLAALADARLGVEPRIFQVRIRSAAHRQEFGNLGRDRKLLVWPLLSAGVQKRLAWLGLAAPEHAPLRPRAESLQPRSGPRQSNFAPREQLTDVSACGLAPGETSVNFAVKQKGRWGKPAAVSRA